MNSKRLGDLVMSVLFMALGIFAIVNMQGQETAAIDHGTTTFRTFPILFGAIMIFLCFANICKVIVVELRDRRKACATTEAAAEQDVQKPRIFSRVWFRVSALFILTLVYALLLRQISFTPMVFVFLFVAFAILGQRKIWLNLIVAAVGTFIIHLIFVVFLRLPIN